MPEKPSEMEGPSLTPKLDRWNKNEEAMSWLAKTLTDPRMEQALDVLVEMGCPAGIDAAALPGENVVEKMALSQAGLGGYHTALRNLRTICVPSQPVPQLNHGGWKGPELRKKFGIGEDGKPLTQA